MEQRSKRQHPDRRSEKRGTELRAPSSEHKGQASDDDQRPEYGQRDTAASSSASLRAPIGVDPRRIGPSDSGGRDHGIPFLATRSAGPTRRASNGFSREYSAWRRTPISPMR